MNRSSSKAHEANAPGLWRRARHCCVHLQTLVSGRPLGFGSSLDRMGFWHGQSRLRLIGRSHTQ
jgi:hypothetical protein